jgi:hypothetical protein
MTYMDKALSSHIAPQDNVAGTEHDGREAVVVVVEDGISLSEPFRMICDCLGIAVERMPSRDDLWGSCPR